MIEDLLAPLAPQGPTDAEIAAVLVRADRRTRRRRYRLAAAVALGAVALTAALAALPGAEKTPVPTTARAILTATAAVAADQPAPPAWTGFRYVQEIDLRSNSRYTIERTEEIWTDSAWQGLRLSAAAKLVAGRLPTADEQRAEWARRFERLPKAERERALRILATSKLPDPALELRPRRLETPGDMPNLYGDGPLAKVPLQELPTDPQQLANLLLEAHKDGRWTPNGKWDPAPAAMKYEVLRDILLLLAQANTTPEQRAALITVLTNYEGVTPLPSVTDHRGREGRGVDIPAGPGVRVIFAPATSELLEWSEPGEVHTYLRFGHVAERGERPA